MRRVVRTSTLRFVAVLASVALTLACYVLPGGAWIAWFALVPLLWALRSESTLARTALGFSYGLGVTALLSDGLVHALHFHLDVPPRLAWLGIAGAYGSVIGLFSGLFGALFGMISRPHVPRAWQPWATAALWTCVEWLRGHAFIGFPFAFQGHTQHRQLWLIQIADLGGVYAVSFVLVLVNAALLSWWLGELSGQTRVRTLASAVAVVVACALYGQLRLHSVAGGDGTRALVGVVQPDLSQGANDEPEARMMGLWRQLDATSVARKHGAKLMVWPETSHYGSLDERLPWRIEYALGPDTDLLLGAMHADADHKDERRTNSAFLARRGFIVARYDKQKLFPFGEYDPTRGLPWIDGKVSALSELRPAEGPGVLPSRAGRVGTLICFEALYPELSAKAVRAGAELLVVMSNDAWFGDTRTNRLTAAMLTFRAVEMRRYLVRAANRGASGVVDPTGASSLRFDLGPERVTVESVRARRDLSVYARCGDWFCFLCGLGLLVSRIRPGWILSRFGRAVSSGFVSDTK